MEYLNKKPYFSIRAIITTKIKFFRRIFLGYLDRVIKRLQMADINNPDLEKQMQAEDYFLKPLLQRDNKISWLLQYKEEKDKVLKENKKELKEKNLIILNYAKILKQAGKSTEEIQQLTNLSVKKIKKL